MPTFVWTAKDSSGKPVIKELYASNSKEAQTILLAEGFSDLKLIRDEIGAAATEDMPGRSAEAQVKARGKPLGTWRHILRRGIAANLTLAIGIVGLAACEIYRNDTWGAIFLGAAFVALLAFIVWNGLPAIYHRKLHRADDWHRWNEALTLVKRIKFLGRLHENRIPSAALARYRAKALTGKGHLEEALREYQRYENRPGCPGWMHASGVARMYEIAKQYDKSLEYRLKSVQLKPDPVLLLDLANHYLRHAKDAVKGRFYLKKADEGVIPDLVQPGRLRRWGTLFYLEKNYEEAKKAIETSIRMMKKTPHLPYWDGHMNISRAYLCCVLAKQGNLPAAKKEFAKAKKYLIATSEDELLRECRSLLGH